MSSCYNAPYLTADPGMRNARCILVDLAALQFVNGAMYDVLKPIQKKTASWLKDA